jgi:isopenicillin N synthase-like dioxygenase
MNEAVHLSLFLCQECNKYQVCSHIRCKYEDKSSEVYSICQLIFQQISQIGFVIFNEFPLVDSILENDVEKEAIYNFFRLPLEEKLKFVSKDRARRGYSPIDSENFATLIGVVGKPNDTVEKYRIGPIVENSVIENNKEYFSTKEGRVHFFPNDLTSFPFFVVEYMKRYYGTMEILSNLVLSIFELCCDLPGGSITTDTDYHTSILTFNYFPLVSAVACDGTGSSSLAIVERIAEHADVSMFTILMELFSFLEDEPSNCLLELFNVVSENWEKVELKKGSFAVNVGDCLQDRSRRLLRSARHRVVESTAVSKISKKERLTSAFFFTPNYNARMNWPCATEDELSHLSYSLWRKRLIEKAMSKRKN